MKWLNQYIDYLHLKREIVEVVTVMPYARNADLKLAERHLAYLKELYDYQKNRQQNIESKNAQLVGQTSIIISIVSLFIPLLIDKLSSIYIVLLCSLIFGFTVILFHYLVTIVHSIKTLQINHYPYSTRSTSTLTKDNRATNEIDFINEEIEDLIWSIDKNTIQNNRKGGNLIYATRSFRIATISTAIFTLLIIAFSFFIKPKPQEIKIEAINSKVSESLNEVVKSSTEVLNIHPDLSELNKSLKEIEAKIDNLNRTKLCLTKDKKHRAGLQSENESDSLNSAK